MYQVGGCKASLDTKDRPEAEKLAGTRHDNPLCIFAPAARKVANGSDKPICFEAGDFMERCRVIVHPANDKTPPTPRDEHGIYVTCRESCRVFDLARIQITNIS